MPLSINPVTVLGLVAGAFTTVAYLPQVIRTWRIKSASDLSLAMISRHPGLASEGPYFLCRQPSG